jgi:hypothetical protein
MRLRALSVRTLLALGLAALPSLQAAPAPKAPAAKPGGHCLRPIPRPVLTAPQPGVASDTFKKTSAREATETAVLDGGATLTITHWGCRAVMLTFRLEAKGLPDFSKDVAGGYQEAVRQLRRLAALKAQTGFNLEKAAAALEAEAKRTKGLAYIRPAFIPGAGKDQVTVQGAGAVPGKGVNYLAFEFMRPLQKKKPAHASK